VEPEDARPRYERALHHRRSIRLPDYDYSSAGAYFITVCTQDRRFFLDRENVRGAVLDAWSGIPQRFPSVALDAFVIMPNHVHGVLLWGAASSAPTAPLAPTPLLGEVMRAFKSLSGIEGNRLLGRSGVPFWQRNYYEHVVRDDDEPNQIREYIINYPAMWNSDPDNPAAADVHTEPWYDPLPVRSEEDQGSP
jgi:REP element-mobilizing transposase RayT